jgi:hypothetical protein
MLAEVADLVRVAEDGPMSRADPSDSLSATRPPVRVESPERLRRLEEEWMALRRHWMPPYDQDPVAPLATPVEAEMGEPNGEAGYVTRLLWDLLMGHSDGTPRSDGAEDTPFLMTPPAD